LGARILQKRLGDLLEKLELSTEPMGAVRLYIKNAPQQMGRKLF